MIKLLAIADAAEKVYGGKSRTYDDIFLRYDLREKTSEPFVKLFFGTGMAAGFKITRIGVNEHQELIMALAPDGEVLFFQEHRYGRPELANEFFHSPKFNFTAAMDMIWAGYPHGLYLSVKPSRGGWGTDVTFSQCMSPTTDVVSKKAIQRIAEDVEDRRQRNGDPWCVLLFGRPGTGKTSHVTGMAAATGGRLLKLDATSLPHIDTQEFGFLIDALMPHYLLVDDFDGATGEAARARMLYLFERLHAGRDLTIAITVNDATKLDEAMLRSQRIDDAKLFELPDAEERGDILGQILVKYNILISGEGEETIANLITVTDGWCQADIKALVLRFQRQPVARAIGDVMRLRALAAASAAKEEKKDAPPDPKLGPT